jgi:hypothetical protein
MSAGLKTNTKRAQLEELLITGKETGARAAIMVWNSTNRDSELKHVREIQVLTEEIGWRTKIGKFRNEEQGGHIEGQVTYLIAAPATVREELGNNKFQMDKNVGTIQDILDEDDNIFTDYFQWQEEINDELKPPNPRTDKAGVRSIIKVIDQQGQEKMIPIFDTNKPGPKITTREEEVGEQAFYMEARDGIILQGARPLKNHRLLRALGFLEEEVAELTRHEGNWKEIFNQIVNTIPRHSFEPIVAAVFHAEQIVAEAKLKAELKAEEGTEGESSAYGDPEKARTVLTLGLIGTIEQKISHGVETRQTGTRRWHCVSTRRTQGEPNKTIEKKGSTANTETYHFGSLPCHTIGRSHGFLQDILANSSQILVARDEYGCKRSGVKMRALQISKRYEPSSATTTPKRKRGQIPEGYTNLPLHNDRIHITGIPLHDNIRSDVEDVILTLFCSQWFTKTHSYR